MCIFAVGWALVPTQEEKTICALVERIYLVIVSREGNHARFELLSKIFESFNVMRVSPLQSVYGHAKKVIIYAWIVHRLCNHHDCVSWTSTTPTHTGVGIFDNPWSWDRYLALCPFTLRVTADTFLHFSRHIPTIVTLRLSNHFAATTLLAYEKFMSPLFISGHFSGYFELYQSSIFSDWKASQSMLEN